MLATTFRVVEGLRFMEAAFIWVNDEVWVLAKKGYEERETKTCSNWDWSPKKNDVAYKKKKKIVVTWKIMGALETSVIYIYIYRLFQEV